MNQKSLGTAALNCIITYFTIGITCSLTSYDDYGSVLYIGPGQYERCSVVLQQCILYGYIIAIYMHRTASHLNMRHTFFFSFLSKRDPRAKGIPPRPKPIVTHTHTHTSDHNILLYCSISIYGSTRTWYPYNIYMISIYTHIYILYRVPLIHSTP